MGPVLSIVEGTSQFQLVTFIHRAAYVKLSDDGIEGKTNSSMMYRMRFGIQAVLSRIVGDCRLAECL